MNEIARLAGTLPPHQHLITGTVAEVQRQVLAGTRSAQIRRVSEISAIGDFAWVVVEPTHLFRRRRPLWPWLAVGVPVLALVAYLVASYAALIVIAAGAGAGFGLAVRRSPAGSGVYVRTDVRVDR